MKIIIFAEISLAQQFSKIEFEYVEFENLITFIKPADCQLTHQCAPSSKVRSLWSDVLNSSIFRAQHIYTFYFDDLPSSPERVSFTRLPYASSIHHHGSNCMVMKSSEEHCSTESEAFHTCKFVLHDFPFDLCRSEPKYPSTTARIISSIFSSRQFPLPLSLPHTQFAFSWVI